MIDVPKQPQVSIIIPTYNGADRIVVLLENLFGQQVPDGFFEVIVVDNASTDGSPHTVANHPSVANLERRKITTRVVCENRKGATFARIRGVCEAQAEIICFLDDDNMPEKNFVAEISKAFSDQQTGLLIARIFPKYAMEPPPSIARREHLLAINNKLGDEVIEWSGTPTFAPTLTAGMCVRREAFLKVVPWRQPELLLADRKGKSLACGGDIEFGFLFGKAGYKRVYNPKLKLWHLIPASRFRSTYICRLIIGIVRSQRTLDARYVNRKFTLLERINATGKFVLSVLASPIVMLRKDGVREAVFIASSRFAQMQGPYEVLSQK